MTSTTIPTFSLPIHDSRRGDNGYIVSCEAVGKNRHYSTCLMVLEKFEAGLLNPESFQDCTKACSDNQCMVVGMRQKEAEAGKSLYYEKSVPSGVNKRTVKLEPVKRVRIDKQDPSYIRGWNQVDGSQKRDIKVNTKKRPPMPLKKQPEESGIIEMNMADIVNAASTESTTSAEPIPVAKSEEIEATGFLPGETPLEYVQRTSKA